MGHPECRPRILGRAGDLCWQGCLHLPAIQLSVGKLQPGEMTTWDQGPGSPVWVTAPSSLQPWGPQSR